MLVNLYAVRIVLNALGAEDYGIYNVVNGLVVIFTFLNIATTGATQRFLNFSIGQNEDKQARNVYSASFIIHAFITLLVVVLAQTVGLWFFFNWLNLPADRQTAAFIAYQFSVATTALSILRIPYHAVIIAHEKMSVFAMIGIAESILKLAFAFMLTVILFDKLIVYAFFAFIIGFVVTLINKIYCNRMFPVFRFKYCSDKKLFLQLFEFSGWSAFSSVANMSKNRGIDILVNIFFGVTTNAAMGIATQVNTAVNTFARNFQTAFQPQIVKSYAVKDQDYFVRLVFQTAKATFFLLFFLALPLFINADFLLQIWLRDVPEYTVIFVQLILLSLLTETIAAPFGVSIQATGNIKKYSIIESCFIFFNFPVSLLFLRMGFNPTVVLIIRVVINIILLFWRIFFVGKRINLPVIMFLREVIVPILVIALVSSTATVFLSSFFIDWTKLIFSCVISFLFTASLIYFIGLNTQEKILSQNWIKNKFS